MVIPIKFLLLYVPLIISCFQNNIKIAQTKLVPVWVIAVICQTMLFWGRMRKTLGHKLRMVFNIVIRTLKGILLGIWKVIVLESHVDCWVPSQENRTALRMKDYKIFKVILCVHYLMIWSWAIRNVGSGMWWFWWQLNFSLLMFKYSVGGTIWEWLIIMALLEKCVTESRLWGFKRIVLFTACFLSLS